MLGETLLVVIILVSLVAIAIIAGVYESRRQILEDMLIQQEAQEAESKRVLAKVEIKLSAIQKSHSEIKRHRRRIEVLSKRIQKYVED